MKRVTWIAALVLLLASSSVARAQLNGGNILGDHGVGAGTTPPAGWSLTGLYYRYFTDTVLKADGSHVVPGPDQPRSTTMQGVAPTLGFVSRGTLLGGQYGFVVAPTFVNGALTAPVFGLPQEVPLGIGDTYFQPFILGWHTKRADFKAALGAFAPTGRYAAGATDNLGKGMWSYEVSGGTTVFLNGARTWSLATAAYWEAHSAKSVQIVVEDRSTLADVTVGQILSLEGGLGKSFLKGAGSVGLAYYAQWKLTDDHFTNASPFDSPLGKHRVYALGPDVTLPIAVKQRLIALVNVRYFWEMGARAKSQGTPFVITAAFPVPSRKIR